MSKIPETTAGTFEVEALASDIPVLVDFYATWCGPCRVAGRILEALAPLYAGRVKFLKINVDEEPELAERFGISGVPTLILFDGGRAIDQIVGLLPPEELKALLDRVAPAAEKAA